MNIMLGIRQIDGYTNIYFSEAAIPQVIAIRYCTLEKIYIRVQPFRYLGCVLHCAAFPRTLSCLSYTSLAFALFFLFS